MKTSILVCLSAALLLPLPSTTQGQDISSPPDSLRHPPAFAGDSTAARHDSSHTLQVSDSAFAAQDSLGRMSTPSLVGTLDRSLDSSQYVTREDLHWIDYRYLGGILATFPGAYVVDQHSAGQYNQATFRGQGWRSIAFLQNGRLLNDPATGIYNPYTFATEYADRIEVITGPRAFLYGLNSTGGVVNVVTRNYNSNRPFTNLNYSESAYGYRYTDGTFSQNVSRKVNLTLGFQFQGMDGRFLNNVHEAWNVRAKARYNVSRDLNIILSEYFTTSSTDLSGGVNLAESWDPFDPARGGATMRNTDAYEKITRHDLDLSVVGTFLGDTLNVSTVSVYLSHNLREYRDEEDRTQPNGILIMSDHTSSWMGLTLSQNFYTGLQRFDAGATLELRQIEGSPNLGRRRNVIASAWGKEDLLLGGLVSVAGYGRMDNYLRRTYVGAGADASLHMSPAFTLFGGFSVSHRMPGYLELYWTDSTVHRTLPLAAEQHRQLEAGAELRGKEKNVFRLAYFHRTVVDPIIFLPLASTSVFPGLQIANGASIATNGLEASARLRVWLLVLEGTGTYLVQRQENQTRVDLPKLSLTGGLYFWNRLLEDRLELKAGVRGRYRSAFSGEVFNPEVPAYVPNTGVGIGYASSVDFFLIAHIGDAYIHFMWENLLNVRYYATPYYPGLDRSLRFGISWQFLN